MDACIRTDDTQLVAMLRRFEGRALFTDAREACDVIVARSPPRVFCSRLGRIEVFAPIPERETPAGPHTHLLPELFHRSSPIADFIPEGLVSCLDLYPANPLRKLSGKKRSFDSKRHARFQKIIEAWGPADYLAEKRRLAQWVREGRTPDQCPPANGPLATLARRVAARQLSQDGANEKTLRAWQRALEQS